MLNLSNNEFNFIIMVALDVRNHSDFVYLKKYILNRLNNTQYDVYSSIKNVNTLWKAFNKKFKVKVIVMERFIVGKSPNLRITSKLSS
jgi:hypothetical protein